jgi:hypothetical protein
MSTELKNIENIEDAWLNLDEFDESDLFNPMSVTTS